MIADGVKTMPVDAIVGRLMEFHNSYPIVGILLLMMGLDVLVGLCAACITKTVSSTISQTGMVRKVVMILLVSTGAVLEPYSGGIPVSKMIAMAFIVTEAISITENAARAGVPVPHQLIDLLEKLRNNEKAKVAAKPVSTVTIDNAEHVDFHAVQPPVVESEDAEKKL